MTVREATESDIPALVDMGERFFAIAPHKFMGAYDRDAVARMLAFVIGNPAGVLLTNGAGAIGGMFVPVYFDPSVLMLEETFWWADKGGGALHAAFEGVALERGVRFVTMSSLENDRSKAIDRVMRGRGYVPIERRYVKEV